MLNPASPLPLKDPTLFRQANYIDGKWVEADNGKTIVVKNPATGEAIGEVPAMGTAETRRAIEAAHRAQPAWRALTAKERAAILRKLYDLMLANADDLARHHDRRAGQAAGRKPRRDRLCRELHRVVRRGGQARLWRHHPAERQGPAHHGAEGADRRVRRDHAVELPLRHDHPQGRPGLGRRLHRRHPPGQRRRRSPPSPSPCWPSAPGMPPGVCNVITGPSGETGGGTHLQPAGAQAHLHRQHRSRRQAAGACARRRSRRPAWSWAATRRSSCSTTPTSTPRCWARWPASTATPARPASAPTASWCRTACTTPSPRS